MLGELIRHFFRPTPEAERLLPETIDRLVAATDARLALLPGYRKALAPGMRLTLQYVDSMGRGLPDTLDLSLLSFTLDRRLGLFFSSPSSLLTLLKSNASLQTFFQSASNGDDAYALLIMQRTDSTRFGVASLDGELRSDVAQTVVSFDHHRLILPCSSIDELRRRSPERGLDVLTRVIAHRLELLEREKVDLECELTRVNLLQSAQAHPGQVLIDAFPTGDAMPASREALAARRQDVVQRLTELKGLTELSGLLELVGHMLEHPQDYLRAELTRVDLDRMGIIQQEGSDQETTHLYMEEIKLGLNEPVRHIVVPVHVSRSAIRELEDCVARS